MLSAWLVWASRKSDQECRWIGSNVIDRHLLSVNSRDAVVTFPPLSKLVFLVDLRSKIELQNVQHG